MALQNFDIEHSAETVPDIPFDCLFGKSDPFNHFAPIPFQDGGLATLFRRFGKPSDENVAETAQEAVPKHHEMEDDVDVSKLYLGGDREHDAVDSTLSFEAQGRYSFQLNIMSSIDLDGKTCAEQFASSDVGHFGHGGLCESHQAYSKAYGAEQIEKRSLEQHIGDRVLKQLKELASDGVESISEVFSGEEAEKAKFEEDLNLNSHHLPAHLCFTAGFMAGFGASSFPPLSGSASWHPPAALYLRKSAAESTPTRTPMGHVEFEPSGLSIEPLFGQRDPFKQISPNTFSAGGIGKLLSNAFGQPTDQPEDTAAVQSFGRYSFQMVAMVSSVDTQDRRHFEKFASSDVGHYGHALRETHQAYHNSISKVEKRGLEQHVGSRHVKWTEELLDGMQHSSSKQYAGMDDSGMVAFVHDLNLQSHHLPAHLGFNGGFLAGFGDHRFAPFAGLSTWHSEYTLGPERKGGA